MYTSSTKLVIALAGLVGLAGGAAAGKRRSRTRLRIDSAPRAGTPGKFKRFGRDVLVDVAGKLIVGAIILVAAAAFGLFRQYGVLAFFWAMLGVSLVGMVICESVIKRAERNCRPAKTIETMEKVQLAFVIMWFVTLIAVAIWSMFLIA